MVKKYQLGEKSYCQYEQDIQTKIKQSTQFIIKQMKKEKLLQEFVSEIVQDIVSLHPQNKQMNSNLTFSDCTMNFNLQEKIDFIRAYFLQQKKLQSTFLKLKENRVLEQSNYHSQRSQEKNYYKNSPIFKNQKSKYKSEIQRKQNLFKKSISSKQKNKLSQESFFDNINMSSEHLKHY